jgi:hypothetical protein
VLVADDPMKGKGEPLVAAWRDWGPDPVARALVAELIDGWAVLADQSADPAMIARDFGAQRGGALFALLTGSDQPDVRAGGALWGLWDLAAHLGDSPLAAVALAEAKSLLSPPPILPKTPQARAARLALAVALPDLRRGQMPDNGFSLRQYGRLLRASFFG